MIEHRKNLALTILILTLLAIVVLLAAPDRSSLDTESLFEAGEISVVFAAHEDIRVPLDIDLAVASNVENIKTDNFSVLNFKQQNRTEQFDFEIAAVENRKAELRLKPKKNTLRPGR